MLTRYEALICFFSLVEDLEFNLESIYYMDDIDPLFFVWIFTFLQSYFFLFVCLQWNKKIDCAFDSNEQLSEKIDTIESNTIIFKVLDFLFCLKFLKFLSFVYCSIDRNIKMVILHLSFMILMILILKIVTFLELIDDDVGRKHIYKQQRCKTMRKLSIYVSFAYWYTKNPIWKRYVLIHTLSKYKLTSVKKFFFFEMMIGDKI